MLKNIIRSLRSNEMYKEKQICVTELLCTKSQIFLFPLKHNMFFGSWTHAFPGLLKEEAMGK